ncbi:hypothetical protein NE237_011967 [Protea cynaroides]|uniref:Uncharacterized protein n=1 Tax=Protea cynaroides TaxID=273540 RepID=A0A9Q0GX37_9MAGN|nr:hypothetical protein NE237_011967 [Protea cynaroides]
MVFLSPCFDSTQPTPYSLLCNSSLSGLLVPSDCSKSENSYKQARDSFGWISSRGSLRSHSLSFSRGVTPQQILDEIESASVSQAGDIGDRTLHSNRCSESDSLQFSVDDAVMQNENSFPEKVLLPSYGFWFRNDTTFVGVSPLSPLPSELVSPISTDAILDAKDKNQIRSVSPVQDNKISLPLWIEYVSYLVHLAVFGILGSEG